MLTERMGRILLVPSTQVESTPPRLYDLPPAARRIPALYGSRHVPAGVPLEGTLDYLRCHRQLVEGDLGELLDWAPEMERHIGTVNSSLVVLLSLAQERAAEAVISRISTFHSGVSVVLPALALAAELSDLKSFGETLIPLLGFVKDSCPMQAIDIFEGNLRRRFSALEKGGSWQPAVNCLFGGLLFSALMMQAGHELGYAWTGGEMHWFKGEIHSLGYLEDHRGGRILFDRQETDGASQCFIDSAPHTGCLDMYGSLYLFIASYLLLVVARGSRHIEQRKVSKREISYLFMLLTFAERINPFHVSIYNCRKRLYGVQENWEAVRMNEAWSLAVARLAFKDGLPVLPAEAEKNTP
ncbi:MAG: hypothetical protein WC901_02030 [Candidatus Margulisiibacteriota bacterium]